MVNFQADLRRATNDENGTCGGTTGPELVYQLNLTQAQDVTISLAGAAGQTGWDGVLFARSSPCSGGAELGCVDVGFSNDPETLTLYNRSGTIFIFAQAYSSTYVALYDVSVVLAPPTPPPANDSCAAPQALTFSGTTATATGSFISAANDNVPTDASPTCSAAARTTGRDVVYSFSTSAAQDVQVTVTPTAAFTPVVYLRGLANCAVGDATSQVGCAVGTSSGLTSRFTNLPAGDYALWVDSTTVVDTGFSLTVELLPATPPPPNDTCAMPEVLALSSNLATASGETTSATNDYNATCSAGSASYGDTVYSLTVPGAAATPVSFVVAPQDPAFIPSLYVGGACPVASPLGCIAGGAGSSSRARPVGLLLPSQAPGQLFAVVDGEVGTGTYRLDARVGAAPNDTCANALPIGLSTTLVDAAALDTTQLANNDFTDMCGSTTRFNGRDLVYAFTPTTSATFTVTVQPAIGFDSSVSVLSSGCTPADCIISGDQGASGSPDSLTFAGTAGQTYYIVVDGYGTSSNEGFFRLEVR